MIVDGFAHRRRDLGDCLANLLNDPGLIARGHPEYRHDRLLQGPAWIPGLSPPKLMPARVPGILALSWRGEHVVNRRGLDVAAGCVPKRHLLRMAVMHS